MSMGKRKWIAIVSTVALLLTLVTGVVSAQTKTDEMFQRLRIVYDVVNAWHKDSADLDKFVNGAIAGGIEALGDPYTQYFSPEDFGGFLDSLNGNFSGIGAYLEKVGNYVVISSPIKNSPAAKAGLQAGDRILEADGVSLVGKTTDEAVAQIRGQAGTVVELKIERPAENSTFTVKVTRANINLPEVEWKMLEEGIGYIELSSFGDDAVNDFYKAVNDLKAQGAKTLVLDLRNNGGGYLDAAVDIASAWVPEGKPVVWEVGKEGKKSLDSTGRAIGLPVVTLVNQGSASASEILSGALQDYKVGPLVGVKTFGKGTVQQILTLLVGGGIKVTIAEYLTPNERHVHGIGLTPDYVVELAKPNQERTAPMEFKRALSAPMTGLDVLYLQYRLQDLGYDVDATGFFGMKTVEAVAAFNEQNGLGTQGEVTEKTVDALNERVKAHTATLKLEDNQLTKALELAREQLKH